MSDKSESISAILTRVDIFDNLTDVQYELVAYLCEQQWPRKGVVLLREQERSDDLYVIVQGGVEILMDPATIAVAKQVRNVAERVLTELRGGQVFGEIALVDQGVRSATARVSRDNTYLLRIRRDRLMSLCDTYPELGYKIMKNLAAELALKLRTTGLTFREYQLTLAETGEPKRPSDAGETA
jgi:CRP/FNR family cyclic AMP-dependent transcriptional regulator